VHSRDKNFTEKPLKNYSKNYILNQSVFRTLATTNQNVGSWDTNLGGKPPFVSHERVRRHKEIFLFTL
jgi:hypothetical protein